MDPNRVLSVCHVKRAAAPEEQRSPFPEPCRWKTIRPTGCQPAPPRGPMIRWPRGGGVALVPTILASNANVADEATNGMFAHQYRELVGDSEDLAQETRDLQTALRADLAELRQ